MKESDDDHVGGNVHQTQDYNVGQETGKNRLQREAKEDKMRHVLAKKWKNHTGTKSRNPPTVVRREMTT